MKKFSIQTATIIAVLFVFIFCWIKQSQHAASVMPPKGNGLDISVQEPIKIETIEIIIVGFDSINDAIHSKPIN